MTKLLYSRVKGVGQIPYGVVVTEVHCWYDVAEEPPGFLGREASLLHQVVEQLTPTYVLQHQVPTHTNYVIDKILHKYLEWLRVLITLHNVDIAYPQPFLTVVNNYPIKYIINWCFQTAE